MVYFSLFQPGETIVLAGQVDRDAFFAAVDGDEGWSSLVIEPFDYTKPRSIDPSKVIVVLAPIDPSVFERGEKIMITTVPAP